MRATGYRGLGIPMQRQSTRRRLVVVVYAALMLLCGTSFAMLLTCVMSMTLPAAIILWNEPDMDLG